MILIELNLFIDFFSIILLLFLNKFGLNLNFTVKHFNYINCSNFFNRRSLNYNVSFTFVNTLHGHTPCSSRNDSNQTSTQTTIKNNEESIIDEINRLLFELGHQNDFLKYQSINRLEYNKDSIINTYELCKETDKTVCNNDYSQFNREYFVRFYGDDGTELFPVCKSTINKDSSIVKIPLDLCHSLNSCLDSLILDIKSIDTNLLDSSPNNILHIKRIQDLSRGPFTKNIDMDSCIQSLNENKHNGNVDSFQHRLDQFISYKKLLVLRSLILSDHILSLDHILIKVLGNPYMKFNNINNNEKELFLLTLALASEYYLTVVASVIKYMYDGREYEGSTENKIKMLWSHRLFKKNSSNIPLMYDKESVEQIQEPILSFKISQRKIVLMDVLGLFTDPVSVITDKLEFIDKSRSMLQDRSDGLFYSAKVDLKSNAEEVLEKIESELYNNDIRHQVFSNNIFSITSAELAYILGNDGRTSSDESKELDNISKDTFENDTNQIDEQQEDNLCLNFFNDYILNSPNNNNIMETPTRDVVSSLNSIINANSIKNFFCTIVSHVIRPGVYETDVMESSYMVNSAPGIKCKIEDESLDIDDYNRAYVVPLIDLCNHSGSKYNSVISFNVSDEKPYFNLLSTKDINAGGEILINYGNFDNNVCFLDYGFVSVDDTNNHVLMDVDSSIIMESVKMHDANELVPSIFPEGIPKEKMDLIRPLNLVEINDKGDLGDLYKNPHFEGMPVVKFMEFSHRFQSNTPIADQSNMYYTSNSKQDRTMYVDKPSGKPNYHPDSQVNPLIKVAVNGIPEHRLILFLKILLCKTKKKLDWIKDQDTEMLSRSINSPIDFKAFEIASSIPLIQMNDKYNYSLYEDYKNAFVSSLSGPSSDSNRVKFTDLGPNCGKLINSLVLAHSMRRKIPIYKCFAFYSNISKTPVPVKVSNDSSMTNSHSDHHLRSEDGTANANYHKDLSMKAKNEVK